MPTTRVTCTRCGYPLGDGERVYNRGTCTPCTNLTTPRRPRPTRTP